MKERTTYEWTNGADLEQLATSWHLTHQPKGFLPPEVVKHHRNILEGWNQESEGILDREEVRELCGDSGA